MFYLEEINGKKILKSDLAKGLKHAFTTRETVIKSQDENLAGLIAQNKKDLCCYFGIEKDNLVSPTQTHSTNIAIAKEGQNEYPQTDAVILTNKTQAVFLNFADCTPIIFFDEINNIAAIAHAGWKGTAGMIGPKTVKKMIEEYNSTPKNIIALIGPAIGQCCYEIGEEVFSKLAATIRNPEKFFVKHNSKPYADLKKINYQQLLDIGIEKIDLCNYCTSCQNELFFSYRKENGTTSRHSAIIKLD